MANHSTSEPAPEPRCACGRPAEDWKHTRPEWTDYHAFTPAPEPSMRMSDEEFNANSAAWNYRFLAEARRTRASEDALRGVATEVVADLDAWTAAVGKIVDTRTATPWRALEKLRAALRGKT